MRNSSPTDSREAADIPLFGQTGALMINAEAGQLLVEYSKHIARWAKMSEQGGDVETPRAKRARNNAWRVLSVFVTFAEHVKESDFYWLLAERAVERGESAREQRRLYAIAKAEDRGYMKAKMQLGELLQELLAAERADPKATKTLERPAAPKTLRAKVESAGASKKVAKAQPSSVAAKPAARKMK